MLLLMEKKSPSWVSYPSNFAYRSDSALHREEMAQLVVQAFQVKLNERSFPVFSDSS